MTWFVSLRHFFTRQSRNTKGKGSLYNVSILKKENDTWKWQKKKKKKDGIVLFVSGEDELDIVLCVKASEFMHTRKHTHTFLIHGLDSQSAQSVPGDEGKERWNLLVLWCPLSLNLPTSIQWFPMFHRMTRQHPENSLGLVFHFCNRRTDQSSESKRFHLEKNKNCTLYYGLLSTFVVKLVASSPCLIVKHWYKILPLLFGSEGLKQTLYT